MFVRVSAEGVRSVVAVGEGGGEWEREREGDMGLGVW